MGLALFDPYLFPPGPARRALMRDRLLDVGLEDFGSRETAEVRVHRDRLDLVLGARAATAPSGVDTS